MTLLARAWYWPIFFSGGLFALVPSGMLHAGTNPTRGGVRPGMIRRARQSGPVEAEADVEENVAGEPEQLPTISVLDGLRTGQIAAKAEGAGDGRITLSLTNRSKRKLRVVLPPGLIASGAAGQFGGMGMGMGGMGGMGGGMMGGMGGGMGGMGGGMGGMGGGMGGMGGGMSGGRGGMSGGMGGGTMPASMGMMMLGRLIMSLVGDRDSWDQKSLMMGMMMGMGGGMMGGMGGGMGGGMMGGMGGGFRSVPPTDLPETTLKPKQTRHLPTAVVSLTGPNPEAKVVMPAKGEALKVGEIGQVSDDPRVQDALKRLARENAPPVVAQLVMWHLNSRLDWPTVEQISRGWANSHELALARRFVDRLDRPGTSPPDADTGLLRWELNVDGEGNHVLAADLRKLLDQSRLIGLKTKAGVPDKPEGPSLAVRVTIDHAKVHVQVATSDAQGAGWASAGDFDLKRSETPSQPEVTDGARIVDAIADGLLDRLVRADLSKPRHIDGKLVYKVRIRNASPLVLNGLALAGPGEPEGTPTALAGFCLSPHRALTVPAGAEMVERLGLKEGVRVVAADLSGL